MKAVMGSTKSIAGRRNAEASRPIVRVAMVLAMALYAGAVLAGGDTSDPLGSGMCWFVKLITGKWVFGLSVVGLVAVAASFISGIEMNEFVKKLAGIFMVACLLLSAVKLMTVLANFFGSTVC